eukprot:11749711-Ditylum_brightwellii.AAC.1
MTGKLHDFWSSESLDFTRGNSNGHTTAALVCLPNSGKLKVVHGQGFGYISINKAAAMDAKLLVLTGEGGEGIGPPHFLMLESSITTKCNIIYPKDTVFAQKEDTKGNCPMFQATNISVPIESIAKLEPIPVFFIYDELEQELEATTVLCKGKGADNQYVPYIFHMKKFSW